MKHTQCHSQVSKLTKCLQRNQSHKCICYYGIVERHSTLPKDLLQNGVAENIERVFCVCVLDIPLSVCLSLSHTAGAQTPAGLGLFMVDFISRSPTCLHTLSRV